ncbi:MAG: D-aminoacylase, partial [Candidatus Angelobacter sp.]|nr:D-aminoacylase [Candidatus Angelobacter sp.]
MTACLLFCIATSAQQNTEAAGPDIVIHGGRIIDGTGNPWYVGDIAISDGRIVALGKIPGESARRVI